MAHKGVDAHTEEVGHAGQAHVVDVDVCRGRLAAVVEDLAEGQRDHGDKGEPAHCSGGKLQELGFLYVVEDEDSDCAIERHYIDPVHTQTSQRGRRRPA